MSSPASPADSGDGCSSRKLPPGWSASGISRPGGHDLNERTGHCLLVRFRLRMPDVANCLVTGGDTIVIDPSDAGDDNDVRVFMLGS